MTVRSAPGQVRAHVTREPAPAKLNLCLRVLEKGPDGRHALWSLVEPLELRDEVEIRLEPAEAPEVTCRCPGHEELDGPGNLAALAATRLLGEAPLHCAIVLRKQIPAGAGLGGGSADAAAVLRGLARLVSPPPSVARVEAIACGLGADVPFCLRSEAALVEGWGERLTPLDLPAHWLCLVDPGLVLSTARVFARHEARGDRPPPPGETRHRPRTLPTTLAGLATLVENDLLPAALDLAPGLAQALGALGSQGPLASGMTGSGALLFGLHASEEDARAASRRLSEAGFRALATAPRRPGPPLWPPAGPDAPT